MLFLKVSELVLDYHSFFVYDIKFKVNFGKQNLLNVKVGYHLVKFYLLKILLILCWHGMNDSLDKVFLETFKNNIFH